LTDSTTRLPDLWNHLIFSTWKMKDCKPDLMKFNQERLCLKKVKCHSSKKEWLQLRVKLMH
jgi:hypothetical protein